jgi:hypothetical protein
MTCSRAELKLRRTLLFGIALIHLATHVATVCAQAVRPVNREPIRWFRYSYDINSSYPYLKELPDFSKIPVLLEWINKQSEDPGVEVAYSQLVALSRADFKHPLRPPAGGMPAESVKYYRSERAEAWARWWARVGQHYEEQMRVEGRQSAEAWKLVIRDKPLPMPDKKIVIPEEWTLKTSYRAGDYGGVQTESLTLRRTKDKATLIRALRKSTLGRLERERWEPLTTEQADIFAFAMAYAIDNPWLVKPDGARNAKREFEGRNLTTYYPGFQYEFTDKDDNIWWNDDPWTWHGGQSRMDAPGILGAVCALLWRTFPDNALRKEDGRGEGKWSSLKMPDEMALQISAEDLALRGEIIEALTHDRRISDALETLTEFGTPAQLRAIAELEAELPIRVEKVKTVLKQDPNGANRKSEVEQLLAAAARAKVAIQKRSGHVE